MNNLIWYKEGSTGYFPVDYNYNDWIGYGFDDLVEPHSSVRGSK